MNKGHFEKRYADSETWEAIDEKRMRMHLESYYRVIDEVIDAMKDGITVRTPFSFYRWVKDV